METEKYEYKGRMKKIYIEDGIISVNGMFRSDQFELSNVKQVTTKRTKNDMFFIQTSVHFVIAFAEPVIITGMNKKEAMRLVGDVRRMLAEARG